MSGIEEIEVRIDPDGTVRLEVHGVIGDRCEALTAQLEAALGGQVLERRHKDSFYQTASESNHAARRSQTS